MLTIIAAKEGGTLRLRAEGPLTAANRHELDRVIGDQLARGERRFVLDLERADYIDSAGLAALVGAAKQVRAQEGSVRIANLNSDLRQLFALTRLSDIFPDADDNDGEATGPAPASPAPSPLLGAAETPTVEVEDAAG